MQAFNAACADIGSFDVVTVQNIELGTKEEQERRRLYAEESSDYRMAEYFKNLPAGAAGVALTRRFIDGDGAVMHEWMGDIYADPVENLFYAVYVA